MNWACTFPNQIQACHSLGWTRKNNLAALCQCNAAWKIVDEAFEKAVAEGSNHLFISASLCVGFSLVNDHFIKIHCVLANKIGRRPAFMYFHDMSSRSLCTHLLHIYAENNQIISQQILGQLTHSFLCSAGIKIIIKYLIGFHSCSIFNAQAQSWC